MCLALLVNGIFEIWGSYRENKDSLIRIQHEQAEAAAAKIGQFIKEIESQVGWTTQLLWSAATTEQRRFDALRLLRQVPAITELSQVDASGKEQLRVSRLAMDVVGSGLDLSKEPKFTEAVKNKIYYGPVYFRRKSEPYMTLSLAGTRRDAGVSIAEVNLKLIWDVVSKIKVGERGQAYVVDAQGRLISHPDISLVLRNTDMTKLAQVQAAQRSEKGGPAEDIETATDIQGRKVLTAFAPVAPLGWTVFVELPVEEAYQPLIASIQRTALVLIGALPRGAGRVGACLPLVIGVAGSIRDSRGLWAGKKAEQTALLGLLAASAIGTAAGARFYEHYYIQLIPPVCLLAAPYYAQPWTGRMQSPYWLLRPALTYAWLAATIVAFSISHWLGAARRASLRDGTLFARAFCSERQDFRLGQ